MSKHPTFPAPAFKFPEIVALFAVKAPLDSALTKEFLLGTFTTKGILT